MKMNTNQSLRPLCGGHKELGKIPYIVELGKAWWSCEMSGLRFVPNVVRHGSTSIAER
jgi:hypothetical protein